MIIICPKCSARYKIPSEITLKKGKRMQCSACQNVFEFQPTVTEDVPLKTSLIPPEDAVLSADFKEEKIVFKKAKPSAKNVVVLPEVFLPVQRKKKQGHFFALFFLPLLLVAFAVLGWLYRDFLTQSFSFSDTSGKAYSRPALRKKNPAQKIRRKISFSEDIPLIFEEDANEDIPDIKAFSIQSVRFHKHPTEDALLIEGVLKNISEESLPVPSSVYALGYGTDGQVLFKKEIYLSPGILHPGTEHPFFGTYSSKTQEVQWVDIVLEK